MSTTLYTKFVTVNASGLPTTLGDSPTFGFYQDANVTLFAAGVTVTSDFNSTTGLNHLQLTVTTSATGIVAGSSYQLVIATGSVSGVTMKGYVIGEFSVLTRSPLRPATANRTLVVDSAGLADATTVKLGPSGSGTAQTARDVGLNVDTTVSSRMATYTQPTGFLAATFPAGTVANTTNITAGTITSTGDFTTQLTESYRANGAAPTPAQALMELLAHHGEASISGTVKTIKKLDHATTAETFTLDSATTPSSVTRAT